MGKYLLESTFALNTQIFHAKKTFSTSLFPGLAENSQRSGPAVRDEKFEKLNLSFLNKCFWHHLFFSNF